MQGIVLHMSTTSDVSLCRYTTDSPPDPIGIPSPEPPIIRVRLVIFFSWRCLSFCYDESCYLEEVKAPRSEFWNASLIASPTCII